MCEEIRRGGRRGEAREADHGVWGLPWVFNSLEEAPAGKRLMFLCLFRAMYVHIKPICMPRLCLVLPMLSLLSHCRRRERERGREGEGGRQASVSTVQQAAAGGALPGSLSTADKTIQPVICSIKNSSALLRAAATAAAAAGFIQTVCVCVCVCEGVRVGKKENHTQTCLRFQVVVCGWGGGRKGLDKEEEEKMNEKKVLNSASSSLLVRGGGGGGGEAKKE